MKIMHIITGLEQGGAENTLYNLLKHLNYSNKFLVVSLTNNVFLKSKFEDLGIKVIVLNMNSNFIIGFYKLIKTYINFKPILIQSWLHHSDFIATLLSIITRNKNIIWTVRCAELNKKFISTKNIYLVKLLSFLSFKPKYIIFNSYKSYNEHIKIGYQPKYYEIIHNGFNSKEFKYDINYKEKFKKKYSIEDNKLLIGFISRYHPIKGFEEYIKFANKLNSLKKNLYFVVAGRGYADNYFVNTILKKYNIPNILFVGNIKNISNFYPALDCIFLTSKSESFPNVIPEAMLSEVFCVSNNVGDVKKIIKDYGYITTNNFENDTLEIVKILNNKLKMKDLTVKGRNHIISNFNLNDCINKYSKIYKKVLHEGN